MSTKNHVRVVTAASLFDGHDAAINIIRRVLQDQGAEVIHLGHNRSVRDVVVAVLQEGAQGVCISSYQGGHMEYFKYLRDLLNEAGAGYVKIFGGGGGVIIHEEKKELEAYGIAQIFHPDDGRRLGLEGMIQMIICECDFDVVEAAKKESAKTKAEADFNSSIPFRRLGLAISAIENQQSIELEEIKKSIKDFVRQSGNPPVLGVTGTGGAGKSSLVDELVLRVRHYFPDKKVGILCVDPTKRKTGGALLGDRIRMNSLSQEGVYMRSLASRGSGSEIAQSLPDALAFCKNLNFDLLIAETSGIGQASSKILEICDHSLYVMTSEFGAQSQLEKIDMIDFAEFIAINKADRRGALDAHRDVQKQYRRSRKLFDNNNPVPVFLTQASNFNDSGVNDLFSHITAALKWTEQKSLREKMAGSEKSKIIPADRQAYLAEIVSTVRQYKKTVHNQARVAHRIGSALTLEAEGDLSPATKSELDKKIETWKSQFKKEEWSELDSYVQTYKNYQKEELTYEVRGKQLKQSLVRESLSHTKIPRVVVPWIQDLGERWKYLKLENTPGSFPYTAGVFPLKRPEEDPTRQFAGEGTPERTNRRFHYLCKGDPARRLSTAFDSVTLYGEDPHTRPDIYGKVGESGVSIATLEDMKKLYAGFDLCDPMTSVSMTINGPAPMMLAFFMNTAIDQQVEKKEKELNRKLSDQERKEIEAYTLSTVRGTVQADILKEDQGQNTCIFSIDFALKMMADIQEYFVQHNVRNFYSVSISGYHIAEAGANPITQLALTLSNAFTFVEYYLARGLQIDQFAPNLSFFFSNGLDPEYTVIGRVARRIWAVAMRDKYHGNDRSQKLKYHIQTSGRSLHAQEIDFNDIRTTLQALIAISDNCNSLHTNAYDEAITTPTEESVRRAKAIQMIINKEFGLNKNENPLQGSYFNEWLTEKVEEAVLEEFLKISERGGVLGAMETQYQRGKIQEESLHYEHLKHSGDFPIVGVNTFIDPKTLAEGYVPPKIEMARATKEEKQQQLDNLAKSHKAHNAEAEKALHALKEAALRGDNIFASLMKAARVCSLGQMSNALYEVGGQYRRNL